MPLAGAISDRINRRLVYGIAAVCAAVWAYLFFIVLEGRSPVMLIVGIVLGLLCHSFVYGPQAAFVVEQFSPRLRSTRQFPCLHVRRNPRRCHRTVYVHPPAEHL